MKKITNSFIRNIVRQSLNESYGLLNEYDIKTTTIIGNIPIGTTVSGMTLPECPDGGFCYSTLDQAKKDVNDLLAGGTNGLIEKYCPSKISYRQGKGIKMGNPTYNNTKIAALSSELWSELTDQGMDSGDIENGLRSLGNFPNFCKSEELFHKYFTSVQSSQNSNFFGKSPVTGVNDPLTGVGEVYDGFEGNTWYGINNDDASQRDGYYLIISELFQASIDESDRQYKAWVEELNKNYEIATQKATEELAASEKLKAAEAAKKAEDAANLAKIGGAGLEGFMINHPTLIKSSVKEPSGPNWNARVYLLDTGIKTIDNFYYGEIVKDGVPLAVKFRKDVLTEPLTLDPDTEWRLKYGTSQSDTWEYDDVIISDDKKSIALTTDTELENPFITTESYRHKGFRHNLLTEVELKYKKKPYLTGPDVVAIQKKLNIGTTGGYGPETQRTVAAFQTKKGITPVTMGDVDEATWTAIMAEPDPIQQTGTGYTQDLKVGMTGPDVVEIQTKLGISTKGGYTTETESKVKEFQEKYKTKLPNSTLGIVDKATFDLIRVLKPSDARKFYSGAKTNYEPKDWIIITPNRGAEGNIFIDQKYYKIKSVSPDRMTVVLDLEMSNTDLDTPEDYSVLKVGGMTAKIVFGNEADGLTKNAPIANNNRDNNSGTRNNNNNSGTRNNNNNSGTRSNNNNSSTNIEKQKQRDVRKKEYCDTLRQIKQYINNNKGGDLTINCQYTPKTRNQIMMALTGGTIVNPATQVTPVDQPQYNVVQPESPTNQSL